MTMTMTTYTQVTTSTNPDLVPDQLTQMLLDLNTYGAWALGIILALVVIWVLSIIISRDSLTY